MASKNDLIVGSAANVKARGVRDGNEVSWSDPPDTGNSKNTVRGALIVLEGLDRSGKTTQVNLLERRLVDLGRKVKVMRFPGTYKEPANAEVSVMLSPPVVRAVCIPDDDNGEDGNWRCQLSRVDVPRLTLVTDRGTPIGQMIDGYLRSHVEMEDHVIHLLFSANRWEAVKGITEHLAKGTTVICDRYYYSGIVYSAAKQNPLLTLGWARAPEIGLPRPDLVLFLDLDEEIAQERGGWGGELYEKGEMQKRVRELFWGLSMGRIQTRAAAVLGDRGGEERSVASPESIKGKIQGVANAPEEVGQGMGPVAIGPTPPGMGPAIRFRQEEEDLQVVDAGPLVEQVAEEIWKIVRPRIDAVERGEVGEVVRRVS